MADIENTLSLSMGTVDLWVGDLQTQGLFYGKLLGLDTLLATAEMLELGRGQEVLIRLLARPQFAPVLRSDAGLYHTAFLYNSKGLLAQALLRVFGSAPQLYQGSADHLVSEAFYFSDPEGNGVELYVDKPRSDWRYDVQGRPLMGSEYIDEVAWVQKYRVEAASGSVSIGHVHLQIGELESAREFYGKLLLLDVTAELPTALFVARDGYHHHLGMNTWHSAGAGKRQADRLGLASFTLLYAPKVFAEVQAKLNAAGHTLVDKSATAFRVSDPWGTQIHILANGQPV